MYLYNGSSGKNLVLNNTTAAGISFTIQKNTVDKFTINDAGEATGVKFIKSGGTSSQFLKADGSIDSNTYLTSADVVTITGAQTITGAKTFNADIIVNDIIIGKGIGNVTGNTVIGENALLANTLGSDNTVIGFQSFLYSDIGAGNVVIGIEACNLAYGDISVTSASDSFFW